MSLVFQSFIAGIQDVIEPTFTFVLAWALGTAMQVYTCICKFEVILVSDCEFGLSFLLHSSIFCFLMHFSGKLL